MKGKYLFNAIAEKAWLGHIDHAKFAGGQGKEEKHDKRFRKTRFQLTGAAAKIASSITSLECSRIPKEEEKYG